MNEEQKIARYRSLCQEIRNKTITSKEMSEFRRLVQEAQEKIDQLEQE